MAEFVHRQDRPGPDIHYAEVRFPDEANLGTGTYTVAVEPAALGGATPVAAVLIKRPVFQLALEVNPQSGEAVATFGRADGAQPVMQAAYRLPPFAPGGASAIFTVSFAKGAIQGLKLEGQDLERVGPLAN